MGVRVCHQSLVAGGFSPRLWIRRRLPHGTRHDRHRIESVSIKVIKLPGRSPNLNAFAERWVRSIKPECLGRLILFGERSLRSTIKSYLAHQHSERPHQRIDSRLINGHKQRPKRCDPMP